MMILKSKKFTMMFRRGKHVHSCRAEVTLTLKWASQQFVLSLQHLLKAMDFNSLLEPMDQAYALFSAIKRMVGLSRKKHSLTAILAPCNLLTKKLCGFETGNFKEAVKYSVANQEGHKWCNGTWDTVLGRNWDMNPCHARDGEDVLIKTMRFTEHREFGMFTIRVQFLTSQGHYKNQPI